MCGGCGRKYLRPQRTAEQLAEARVRMVQAQKQALIKRPQPEVRKAPDPVVPASVQAPLLKPPV